jgi:hypothetical protein
MPMRQDEEFVHKTVKQFFAQQAPKKYTVKLPCHRVQIELPEGKEVFVTCPEPGCGKKYMIANNLVNKRLYAQE